MSETFNYLQKFMQIHPLRTTQIEFENAIKEFKEQHERIFLEDGKKKWENKAM